MGWKGWREGRRFVRGAGEGPLVCLFNAPLLLAALFGTRRQKRRVAVLDWTESYPSLRPNWWTPLYDAVYLWAFSRMDAVFSPALGFRDYYNARGAGIQPCLYPLPSAVVSGGRTEVSDPVRVLYVGANIQRKGGDHLLQEWKKKLPDGATLTFVSPHAPQISMDGVQTLLNIRAGTTEQELLFVEHDIFILPTREEPFGFALLEAIQGGLCVITTNAAGGNEYDLPPRMEPVSITRVDVPRDRPCPLGEA